MHTQRVSPAQRRHDEAIVHRALGAERRGEIVYVDEGWDSRVYVVSDGEVVFKFPRSPALRTQFRLEVAALRLLEDKATQVLIPRVRYEDPDLEYFGYAGVVGRSLAEVMASLGPGDKVAVGTAIGGFLRALHRLDLDGAPTTTVVVEAANYAGYLESGRPALAAQLTVRELRLVEAFVLDELPDAIIALGSDLRLCHADLGPWNLIVSPAGGVGVIDFGDVGYYDASKDFSGFGDDVILRAALDAYGADDLLRAKAALRVRAFPVLDLPFYVGKNDRAGIDACIELVRRAIIDGGGFVP